MSFFYLYVIIRRKYIESRDDFNGRSYSLTKIMAMCGVASRRASEN